MGQTTYSEEYVESKIKEILFLHTDNQKIKQLENHHSIWNDLYIDSLSILSISMDIEEMFNITINNDDIDKFKTVNDVLTIVKSKIF